MTDRRHFMQHAAGMGALGLPAFNFFSKLGAAAGPVATKKRDHKSMIIIWMNGGAAVKDFWDIKPGHANNWAETTKTAASGVEINKLLPKIAEQMKHFAIIRSNTRTEGDHNRGTILTATGRTPNPLSEWPSMGSMLSFLNKETEADLPSFIGVGGANGARGPGFLGMKFAPFNVQNAGTPPENIRPPQDVSTERMERRAGLFGRLEAGFQGSTKAEKDAARAHQEVYEKALSLVVSKNKDVFGLANDTGGKPMSTKLSDSYGATGTGASAVGRGALLARKLVEAGSSCVVVSSGFGWDMHNGIKAGFERQLPAMDKAIGGLMADLVDRGLNQEVVVTLLTEFDRTPRINQNAGRDHWPRTNSVLVGGGLIKGGQVYGSTNEAGDAIKDNPVNMNDLFATYFAALGIKPDTQVRDNLGRPGPIAGDKAKVIAELVG
ncbi:MAG: DUF1501 domain-containing protein [Planctomycetes bacterium]|nr:DUF1501 domain-containing protein [Planctomycetota bacterium]